MRFTQNELKAAIKLKGVSVSDLAKRLGISLRMLEYYMKGEKKMRKDLEFLELLQPELSQITGQPLPEPTREARRRLR